MGPEQPAGIFLIVFSNLLKVGFFVSIVWLFIQWWREARYFNEHSWIWMSFSPAKKKRIAKKFSIFGPVTLLAACIILYLIKVFFVQCRPC
ncbi:MAG: hypothetical protein WC582_03545 [Patescibacteria group bacterium]